MKIKIVMVMLSVALIVGLILTGCVKPAAPEEEAPEAQTLIFATSAEGSSSYAMGGVLSTAAIKFSEGHLAVMPKPTAGGIPAAREVDKGTADTWIATAATLSDIRSSTGAFLENPLPGKDNIEALVVYGCTNYAVFVRAELADEIKCWRDLEGHTVFQNPTGTLPYDLGVQVFEALGIWGKYEPAHIDYKAVSDAVKTGEVDALFVYGTEVDMTPYFYEVEARNHLIAIPMTEEEQDTITEKIEVVAPASFKLPTESFVHDVGLEEVNSYGICGFVATQKGRIDETTGYWFIKIYYENWEELGKGAGLFLRSKALGVNPGGSGDYAGVLDCLEMASEKLGVKVHPGTYRYFLDDLGIDLKARGLEVSGY